jgi:hypothetical protein
MTQQALWHDVVVSGALDTNAFVWNISKVKVLQKITAPVPASSVQIVNPPMIHRVDSYQSRFALAYGDASVEIYSFAGFSKMHRIELNTASTCQVYACHSLSLSRMTHHHTSHSSPSNHRLLLQ